MNAPTPMLNVQIQSATTVATPTPSFVDMRAFANDHSQGVAAPSLQGEDCFLASRRILDWAPGPVTAGVIALEAGNGSVQYMPEDEFIIVHKGSLTLTQSSLTLTLKPGQSAVIPQGTAFLWSATETVSLIFTRYSRSHLGERTLMPIQQAPELKPSGSPSLDLLTTPVPSCRNFTDYTSADGEFMCGTWDSTPYARKALFYRHFELMHLLEGSVDFVDEVGRRATFSKGDIFLIEQGASCTWDSRNHVVKVYVIYRPK
jgi:uncharacterized cupin superfamily protein